jgi:hypothetical protein
VLGNSLQISVEFAALIGGERLEELALRLGDGPFGAAKALCAGLGELDQLPAAVARITAARNQPVHFELVEKGYEVRGMKAEGSAELAAVGGAALFEPMENRELMASHSERSERAAQRLARHPGDAGKEDSAA